MKRLIYVVFLILVASFVYAIPAQPHRFYGEVTINDIPAPDGAFVTAEVNGVLAGEGATSDGKYGYDPIFLVTDPNANREGQTIKFYVNGIDAQTSTFHNGWVTELNLSVTCEESWTCTDWSSCVNSTQTRECNDANNCLTTVDKPAETQACTTGGGDTGGSSGGGGGSGGSGGGGGGGSGSTNPYEVYRFYAIITPTMYGSLYSHSAEIAFSKLLFRVNKILKMAKIIVTVINDTSLIDVPLENIYQYLEITFENMDGTDDIAEATIEFKVSKSWINTNNYDKNSITLYRLVGSQWVEIETNLISEDDIYYRYEVVVPGYSKFAIVAGKIITPEKTPKPTEPPKEPVVQSEPPGVTGAATAAGSGSPIVGILIVVIIAAVGIGFYLKKRR